MSKRELTKLDDSLIQDFLAWLNQKWMRQAALISTEDLWEFWKDFKKELEK